MSQNFGNFSAMDSRAISILNSNIATARIFVISKTKCSVKAKALLNMVVSGTQVTPRFFDLDTYPSHYSKVIMNYISTHTGVRTVPQIWIHGKFIGGNSDIQRLHQMGQLMSLIRIGSKPRRTYSSLSRNYVKPMIPIAPINAEVPFKPNVNSIPVNTNTHFHNRGNMSIRPGYFRSSVYRNEADRSIQRGYSMPLPSSRARTNYLNYSGNALLNTNTNRRMRSFSSQGGPLRETGKIPQLQWPSDEEIPTLPSDTHQPRGALKNEKVPDFAIVSRWI